MSLYTLLCGCLEVQKPTTGSSLGAVVERLRASAAVRGGSLAAHNPWRVPYYMCHPEDKDTRKGATFSRSEGAQAGSSCLEESSSGN